MVKYSGRFVVEDKANNRRYLADLAFKWDRGDPLTPFTLGGTVPTLAANGNIDFRDAGAPFGFSSARLAILPLGEVFSVLHLKLTRLADDSNSSGYFGMMDSTVTGGLGNYIAAGALSKIWINVLGGGTFSAMGVALGLSQEYTIDVIMTPGEVIFFVDGVRIQSLPVMTRGNAQLGNLPIQSWRAMVKYLTLFFQHGVGDLSHYQVRDIKVGRLVGVSW